jgi:Domain of unknown function (DUF5655)
MSEKKDPMTTTLAWQHNRDMWIRVLEKQTGEGVDAWNSRIRKYRFSDEPQLRTWLSERNVTGYAQQLLVMERFGYPDFVLATADELVDKQYEGAPQLRAVYDAIVKAAASCGEVVLQARKTFVSLVSPRRTFARIQRAGNGRVNLGLRLDGQRPVGRLVRSNLHETMRLQIPLASVAEVDAEVRRWLKRAYLENS